MPSSGMETVDVAIVGGGPSGCCLAALMAADGFRVAVIDRETPVKTLAASFDGRTTALSVGSKRIFEQAGLWDDIAKATCPIGTIHITEDGADPLTVFDSVDAGEDAFGWIAENAHVRACLYRRLDALNALYLAPATITSFTADDDGATIILSDGRTIRSTLAVGADGKNSFMRKAAGIGTRTKDYGQTATVCVVRHENPHDNIAVEDFRNEGPFAILPMPDDSEGRHRSSIVWTSHGNHHPASAAWDEETFNAALAERFPARYGRVTVAAQRFSYPLSLVQANAYVARRLALIADAAHAIHPIAGQGLNLGLRDVAVLANLLSDAKKDGRDIGGPDLLSRYEKSRRADVLTMTGATDLLNGLFSNDVKTLGIARRQGLRIVERFRPAKRFFMRHAMGLSRLAKTPSHS